jgi:hypothetical protein
MNIARAGEPSDESILTFFHLSAHAYFKAINVFDQESFQKLADFLKF